jgi:beta-lactamase class A
MTRLWLITVILVVARPADASDLEKKLEKMAASHRGRVALYAKNLTTGETVSLDSGRPVQTASVIKLPLMIFIKKNKKSTNTHKGRNSTAKGGEFPRR